MSFHARSRHSLVVIAGFLVSIPLLVGQGCPSVPGPGNPVPGTGQEPEITIASPSVDRTVVIGETVTIAYSVTSPIGGSVSVSAFYDRDGVGFSDDEVIFDAGLLSGTGRTVTLDTSALEPGPLYVGILAENDAGFNAAYAPGELDLVASPSLVFTAPEDDRTVGAGVAISMALTAGTGVTDFSWTIFYDVDQIPDNLNEEIIFEGTNTNSSNVEKVWDTTGLAPGTYFLGARIVTSLNERDVDYAPGSITITSGPFIDVRRPEPGLSVAIGTPIPVVVDAGNPGGETPEMRIFYDPDNDALNGNSVDIATVPASAGGTVWRPSTDIQPGMYYVGAELIGTIPAVIDYISDPIQLLGATGGGGGGGVDDGGSTLLTMRTPRNATLLSEGETFTINWSTSLKLGEGTIEIWREPDANNDGVPDGESQRKLITPENLDASLNNFELDTDGMAGKYYIVGRVTPTGEDPVTDYAPGSITIMPPFLWVGHLESLEVDEEPDVQRTMLQGAVFRGFQNGDNLGSAMSIVDDYDGDGVNEVVLVSQFGKPGYWESGGRGAGEAYMIYGQTERYLGNYEVNGAGSDSLPGLIFTGIMPNPNQANTEKGRTGTALPYNVAGQECQPYETEGLRGVMTIPDQDGDGLAELVFSIPFCNSYSLSYQVTDGIHPAPLMCLGRLENNGHFLRGGLVIVSSTNSLLTSRTSQNRHFDRVMMLQEVGQVFGGMCPGTPPAGDFGNPVRLDYCPRCADGADDEIADVAVFPGEGFYQNTLVQTQFPQFALGSRNQGRGMDPPRLADPQPADLFSTFSHEDAPMIARGENISISQIDAPPSQTSAGFLGGRRFSGCVSDTEDADGNPLHPFGRWPTLGTMRLLGTGFYYDSLPDLGAPSCSDDLFLHPYHDYCPSERIATAREPYGARILGQTTSQPNAATPTTADLFGYTMAVSGEFLLIGAPNRTAQKADVTALRMDEFADDRPGSGAVYMLQLRTDGVPDNQYLWNSQGVLQTDDDGNTTVTGYSTAPAPHNYIIKDIGYSRCIGGDSSLYLQPGDIAYEMSRPFFVLGQEGEHIGAVTGLMDMDNDGVDDFAVGGAGTNGDRGAVYILYRRMPHLEEDYLLERIQLPLTDLDRLNGLFIKGREGENLGTSIGEVGPRSAELGDDFNADGQPDLLIGSPYIATGSGFDAGEVFILFGGERLASPADGVTIPELRDAGHGMVLQGVQAGAHVGTTVASAGDANNDGIADILISAPEASPMFDSDDDGIDDTVGLDLNGDGAADDLDGDGTPDDMTEAGLVYLVFGGSHLTGTISLDQIGTENLPGIVFVGREGGDHLGGGRTQNGLLSRGLNSAGDLDGDGQDDFFISSVLADPGNQTDAGEVYLIYGFGTAIQPR